MAASVRYVARSAVLRAILLGTTTLNLFNYLDLGIRSALYVVGVLLLLTAIPAALLLGDLARKLAGESLIRLIRQHDPHVYDR